MSRATELFAQFPARIRETIDAAEVIVIVKDHSGICGMATAGIASHADAILLLATGINMTHSGHDTQVLDGAAAAEAQARPAALKDNG